MEFGMACVCRSALLTKYLIDRPNYACVYARTLMKPAIFANAQVTLKIVHFGSQWMGQHRVFRARKNVMVSPFKADCV